MEDQGVTVNKLRPLIKSFFEGITAEQWNLLTSGTPDDPTQVRLVELLLELIACISNSITAYLQLEQQISEKEVRDNLGDALRQSFAQELNVEEDVVKCEALTKHLVTEVTASMNSSMSNTIHGELFVNQHVTPPSKLTSMVSQTGQMIKKTMTKVKSVCVPQHRKPRSSPSPVYEADQDEVMSRHSGPFENEDVHDDSTMSSVSKVVEDVLKNAITELIEPLLDQVDEPEYERQQSESFTEIEAIGKEIALTLIEESVHGSGRTSPKNAKIKLSRKIQMFFVEQFAKTWIQRLVEQIKTKYSLRSNGRQSQCMKCLVETVHGLIVITGGREVINVAIARENEEVFVHLVEQLNTHILPPQTQDVNMHPKYKNIYHDVCNKVGLFLSVINWWLTQRLCCQSDTVVDTILDKGMKVAQKQLTGTLTAESPTKASRTSGDHSNRSPMKISITSRDQRTDSLTSTTSRDQRIESPTKVSIMSKDQRTESPTKASITSKDKRTESLTKTSITSGENRRADSPAVVLTTSNMDRPKSPDKRKKEVMKERNRITSDHLVVKVMSRIFKACKNYGPYMRKVNAFTESIMEKTRVAAESVKFEITPKHLNKLYKKVVRDLINYSGSVNMVAFAIVSDDVETMAFIELVFKAHLTTLQKHCSTYRFIRSIFTTLVSSYPTASYCPGLFVF